MNVVSTILSFAGDVLYRTVSAALGVLPSASQPKARFRLDTQETLLALIFGRLLSPTRAPTVDLDGQVAIVTGASSGIGLSIATDLARWGATVYLACRNDKKAQGTRDEIIKANPAAADRLRILKLETSDLASVRACAKAFKQRESKLDIIIHNAGISTPPDGLKFSTGGFEIVYATNFLGSYLLTYLLEDALSKAARIVFTTSNAQVGARFSNNFSVAQTLQQREEGFHLPRGAKGGSAAYAHSKAMQCAFSILLQRRFNAGNSRERGRIAHTFDPGFTQSEMAAQTVGTWSEDPIFAAIRTTGGILDTPVSSGAATGLWLATTDDEAVASPDNGAHYWSRMSRRMCSADLLSEDTLRRLWQRWEADAGIEWR